MAINYEHFVKALYRYRIEVQTTVFITCQAGLDFGAYSVLECDAGISMRDHCLTI